MEGKLQNEQPVWKKEVGNAIRYIYYNRTHNRWAIDRDFNERARHLQGPSDDAYLKLKAIPQFGWVYGDDNKWATDDTSLTISGGY